MIKSMYVHSLSWRKLIVERNHIRSLIFGCIMIVHSLLLFLSLVFLNIVKTQKISTLVQPRGLASKDDVVRAETAALVQVIVEPIVNPIAILKWNVDSLPQLGRKTVFYTIATGIYFSYFLIKAQLSN